MIVPDPLVVEQMEFENTEAATNNTTEANETVMADDNVEPKTMLPPLYNQSSPIMLFLPQGLIPWNAHSIKMSW